MKDKEKYIIDQIGNHTESVNTDDLWADLAGHIPQPKKKKRGVIWFTTGLTLLALILLFVSAYSWNVQNSDNDRILLNVRSAPSMSDDEQYSDKQIVNTISNKHQEVEHQSSISNLEKNDDKNESGTVRTEAISEIKIKEVKLQKGEINNDQSQYQEPRIKGNYSKKLELDKFPFTPRETSPTTLLNTETQISTETKATLSIAGLDALELSGIPYESEVNFDALQPKIIELKKSSHFNRWSIYGSIGAGLVDRSLSTNDNELRPELQRRELIEKVQGQWQIDLGIGYRLTPRLTMTSGLQYHQIHEEASFNTEFIEPMELEKIVITHLQDGTVDQTKVNGSSGTLVKTKEVRKNSIKFLHVPVGLRYDLLRINEYKLSLSGELAFNISQKYDGFTSFNDNDPSYNLKDDDQGRFFGRSMLVYGLGIDISKPLTANVDAIVGISFRKTTGINSKTYLIDQSYDLFTVKFGAQHRF